MNKFIPIRHLTPRKLFLVAYDMAASVVALILSLYLLMKMPSPGDTLRSSSRPGSSLSFIGYLFSLSGFYSQCGPRGSQYRCWSREQSSSSFFLFDLQVMSAITPWLTSFTGFFDGGSRSGTFIASTTRGARSGRSGNRRRVNGRFSQRSWSRPGRDSDHRRTQNESVAWVPICS